VSRNDYAADQYQFLPSAEQGKENYLQQVSMTPVHTGAIQVFQ
jgi:hypothetical protein